MEEVNVTTQNIEETAPAESMADYAGEIDSSMREISVLHARDQRRRYP